MPLTLFKRGDIWHYRGTVAGRRLRGSTKTADKKLAQRIASDIEARNWKGHLDGPGAVLTFAQAAMLYRQGGKPDRFLVKIEDYWKDTPVRQIIPSAVRDSAPVLYPGCGGATWNRQVIVPTQAIINYAAERELCQPIKVKRYKFEKDEKVPADWAWVQSFMAVAPPLYAALGAFLFLTGARISEALAVKWSDVDFANRRVRIEQTKIGHTRLANMPPALIVALANLTDREDRVFPLGRQQAGHIWKSIIAKHGLRVFSFHALRHGFATSMLQAGVDPITVAKRGGWRSPQHLFQTYGHASEDERVTDVLTGPREGFTNRGKAGNA
jgi:integrase